MKLNIREEFANTLLVFYLIKWEKIKSSFKKINSFKNVPNWNQVEEFELDSKSSSSESKSYWNSEV